MKEKKQVEEKIFQEIDKQVEELKQMINEQYKNATMDEMEFPVIQGKLELKMCFQLPLKCGSYLICVPKQLVVKYSFKLYHKKQHYLIYFKL